ncbi:MAG: glycosyltransferase 87 family protein [Phaeodactylibacter sp.]|uniref:glycosyltransferase 87 family protein n=1 Tax=Phaeodactylibacter sp. TaxID=1940289 RepID=UPI0032EB8716
MAERTQFWLGSGLLLLSVAALAYGPGQADFAWIAGLYLPAFLAYLWLCTGTVSQQALKFYLVLAVGVRALILPAMPQLSDDVYRFIWDGRLLLNGINPFEHLPAYYQALADPPAGLTDGLFQKLNSPEYFTIYPPVAQAVFGISCWLAPNSIYGSTLLMKGFLLLTDIGTVLLLPRLLKALGQPPQLACWYLLNPLIIVETTGNLHFEGAMVFFLVLSFWWLHRKKWALSAVAMALAVATKLLPLLFLMFFIRRLGWRRSIYYFGMMGLALLLLFAPLLSEAFLKGFGSSLDLYFRRFEFNGSVYYLLRWIGYQWTGYNQIAIIGPLLAAGTFLGVVLLAIWDAWLGRCSKTALTSRLPALCLAAIVLYLAFTPTVHPWYVALPILLCTFTPYRFPVVWSILIVLTYANYSGGAYHEYLGLVALEYLVVAGYALWEWRQQKKRSKAVPLSAL